MHQIENRLLEVAPIGSRVIAAIIDVFIWLICIVIIIELNLTPELFKGNNGKGFSVGLAFSTAYIYFGIACWLVIYPLKEGLSGQTFGKQIMGIKVVAVNDKKISIIRSFLRHIFDIADLFLFVIFLVDPSNIYQRRSGDWIANTRVVKNK